jgi:hypothetical protein
MRFTRPKNQPSLVGHNQRADAHRRRSKLPHLRIPFEKGDSLDILWPSDGGTAAADTIIGTANSLRDYFPDVKRGRGVRTLGGQKRPPRPPLSLKLSYIQDPSIEDPALPNIFMIAKGQF